MPLSVSCTPSERGKFMKIAFLIKPHKNGGTEKREFKVDDTARICFKFSQPRNRKSDDYSTSDSSSDSDYLREPSPPTPISISISLKKCLSAKNYTTKLNIKFFGFSGRLVCPDEWTDWINVGKVTTEYEKEATCLYNSVQLEASLTVIKTEVIAFAKLYDDTITTDFSMSTKDGAVVVAFHRNCLLAHSDMFKTLFQSGDFVDKEVFKVGIKEVTDRTIQQLKDYVYLGILPDDGVRPLLLLAKCYLFDNLQAECITQLVETVSSENLHSLMAFACEYNIPELAISLMQQTPEDVVFHAHLLQKRQKCKRSNEDREPEKGGKKKRKEIRI